MTLQQLNDNFNHWRSNKKRKSEQIPQYLWQDVFALEAQGCPIGHICQSLSLSGTQVAKQRAYHANSSAKQSTGFIDITPQMVVPDNNDSQCEVTLNLNDKTLALSLPVGQLRHILPNLKGLLV